MYMKRRVLIFLILVGFVVRGGGRGCARKKYVRQTVNERVTPLEGRTQELEETVRRNTQDIRGLDDRLTKRIDDVSGRTDRAQATADAATAKATEADTKAQAADAHARRAENEAEDLRTNLDSYTLLTTVAVNFRLNSAQLTPNTKAELDTIALEAKNHKGYMLEIQGFTDASGSVAANDQLSQERAETVQRYLAKQHQ